MERTRENMLLFVRKLSYIEAEEKYRGFYKRGLLGVRGMPRRGKKGKRRARKKIPGRSPEEEKNQRAFLEKRRALISFLRKQMEEERGEEA